jgi:ATP-dependent DNA helicase RecQ
VMQGRRAVRLVAAKAKVKKTRVDEDSWANVDSALFEVLRKLRRQLAEQRGVPAYILFSDVTLRAMARTRPGSPNALLEIRGVGERKLEEVGQRFLDAIANYCHEHRLPLDV